MVATLASKDRLDINITTTFIELALTTLSTWASDREHMLKNDRSGDAPYKIRNRTGCPILIWHDQDSTARKPHEERIQLENEETIDWRFDDLKTTREVIVFSMYKRDGSDTWPKHLSSSRNNIIGIQLQGRSWEPLRSIPVDREGEYVYVLRPRSEAVSDRLLCEIRVQDNVKIVIFRSTYLVQNFTLYPLELVLVDSNNKPAQPLQKIGEYVIDA
jgi:vacuolar protein sorting-associated protein 13A/C